MTKTSAIIAAGGSGSRLGKAEGKQLLELNGFPIIYYAIKTIRPFVDEVILVIRPEDVDKAATSLREAAERRGNPGGGGDSELVDKIIAGGATRTESVRNALNAISKDTDIVIIHDGARPFVSAEIVKKSIEAALEYGASVVSVPVKDTIKEASPEGFVASTPARSKLWAAQTPQTFKYEIIKKAYNDLKTYRLTDLQTKTPTTNHQPPTTNHDQLSTNATDDASLVESLGYKVKIVEGDYRNIKITTEEDLRFAEWLTKYSREGNGIGVKE
ncbi:2-C-methyl-D-erythritol 4-phosphate cytidylyltransferase [Candidatus Margulisiibacteriota bacterium]